MIKPYAVFTRVLTVIAYPVSGFVLHNSRRVRVLIRFDDQVLLAKSSIGHQKWSIPGGGIEKNENPMSAVVRETLEEVNIVITEDMLVCTGEQRTGKNWPRVDMIFYIVDLPIQQEPHITRPLEILEAQWFELTNLPDDYSETLSTALNFAKTYKLNIR